MSYSRDPDYSPDQWRDKAAQHRQDAAESFERSDTDGFVSQWASGVNARLAEYKATLAENGGRWTYPALFDLSGNLVAAKEVETRYGWSWGILESDDPHGRITRWFNPSKARNADTERANNAAKGFYVGKVKAKAKAELGGSGTGLSGALTVHPYYRRADGGFSRDVEVIDNGQAQAEPQAEA